MSQNLKKKNQIRIKQKLQGKSLLLLEARMTPDFYCIGEKNKTEKSKLRNGIKTEKKHNESKIEKSTCFDI